LTPQVSKVLPTEEDTRSRLIQAAGKVFADVGYQAATVRDICTRAGANVAAVNYHFGDKLKLYTEVLRQAICIESDHAPPFLLDSECTPKDKLAMFVKRVLRGTNDPARPAWATRLMLHEMAQPTPSLGGVVEEIIRPKYDQLRGLIGEVLGVPPSHRAAHLCAHSIIGQVRHYAIGRCVISRLSPELEFTPESLDQIAGHITKFSMAGLKEVQKNLAQGRRNDRTSTIRQASA
jgi:TetR/AcrR family transcriptional regulator, regulator of cefoperazone and chloramphenicol sensitivity